MLTKSRFKKAIECPTKLYYSLKKYKDESVDDPFLAALAEGGIQVGELAKLHFPEGVEVREVGNGAAAATTERLLREQPESTLFEPAFQVGMRMARVDIFRRVGNEVEVIEVKSKGVDDETNMLLKGGKGVTAKWFGYVADLAFQRQLVEDWYRAKGEVVRVKGFLMLMDKGRVATVNHLNAKFAISRTPDGRASCRPDGGLTLQDIGEPLLVQLDLTEVIQALEGPTGLAKEAAILGDTTFDQFVKQCEADVIQYDAGGAPRSSPIGAHCKKCEFSKGKEECWQRELGWGPQEFERPKVWDIWNGGGKLFEKGIQFLDEVEESDLGSGKNAPRQWTQVLGTKTNNPQIDVEGLRNAMAELQPPYHFIDFETSAPAIPHFAGMRPHEGLSFQFSHHVMDASGSITHRTQCLETGRDMNPTFAFVDALYKALANESGTIFRYASHENTYLNIAHRKLSQGSPFDVEHTQSLLTFIEEITYETGKKGGGGWSGQRKMVDLKELVEKHFWHPRMKGSNSIKDVLPAVLASSRRLKDKYSQPVYGTADMPSLNFTSGHVWFRADSFGQPINPYKFLPSLSDLIEVDLDDIERFFAGDELNNGGAAMIAWSYMQHVGMHPEERKALEKALLHYCELDTLAMVFIWEHFQELTEQN